MTKIQNCAEKQKITKTKSLKSGTKTAKLIEMLEGSEGASIEQIMQELKWQRHTVRSALSKLTSSYNIRTISNNKANKDRTYQTVKND